MPDGCVPFEKLWGLLIIQFHMQPSEADRLEIRDAWDLISFNKELTRKPAMSREEFIRNKKKLNL